MEFKKLKKEVSKEISRIESEPKFYLSALLWNDADEIKYTIALYSKTPLGKELEKRINHAFPSVVSPTGLVKLLKVIVNETIQLTNFKIEELTVSE